MPDFTPLVERCDGIGPLHFAARCRDKLDRRPWQRNITVSGACTGTLTKEWALSPEPANKKKQITAPQSPNGLRGRNRIQHYKTIYFRRYLNDRRHSRNREQIIHRVRSEAEGAAPQCRRFFAPGKRRRIESWNTARTNSFF